MQPKTKKLHQLLLCNMLYRCIASIESANLKLISEENVTIYKIIWQSILLT